jgi:hypothetical protein
MPTEVNGERIPITPEIEAQISEVATRLKMSRDAARVLVVSLKILDDHDGEEAQLVFGRGAPPVTLSKADLERLVRPV